MSIVVRSVLLPLDGSPLAEEAYPWALDMAVKYQAELVLLRVGRPPDVFSGQDLGHIAAHQAGQEALCMDYLRALELRWKPPIPVRLDYVAGHAGKCIVERCQSLGISLVVMSTHGREGLERWFLGSVAERVSRHAPCPVLLVRHPNA